MNASLADMCGEICKLSIYAMKYGGDDEKQYCIERVLEMIAGEEWVEKARAEFMWTPGKKFEV